jgi:hypothetical protein
LIGAGSLEGVIPAKAGIHFSSWNKRLVGFPVIGKTPGKRLPRRRGTTVIPAKAGIHGRKEQRFRKCLPWGPACAGTAPRGSCLERRTVR